MALVVAEGPAGCCLDGDGRKAGESVTLANGIAAHYLPGTPESGGPILWWQQEGSYIALSGPQLTQDALVKMAASMSKTADLGRTVATPPRPTSSALPPPAFAILHPAWLPGPLALREEYPRAAGPTGPASYAILHFDAPSGDNPQDALLLIEQPQALAANPATVEPGGVHETIGGRDVTIGYRGAACMNMTWVDGGIVLTLVNSYSPPGQPRYSCDQLRQIWRRCPNRP